MSMLFACVGGGIRSLHRSAGSAQAARMRPAAARTIRTGSLSYRQLAVLALSVDSRVRGRRPAPSYCICCVERPFELTRDPQQGRAYAVGGRVPPGAGPRKCIPGKKGTY